MNDSVFSQTIVNHDLQSVWKREGSSLISLLKPSQMKMPSSASSSINKSFQPKSFEQPFDDPNMEPLPLAPFKYLHVSPSMSSVKEPSFQAHQQNLNAKNGIQHNGKKISLVTGHSLPISSSPSIVDPTAALVAGIKRSFESSSSQQHNDAEDPIMPETNNQKRQKLHHPYEELSDKESAARFAPYQTNQWRLLFKRLVDFKLRTGHCCVPQSYAEDVALVNWVKRQRYQYKKLQMNDPKSTMTSQRIEELESIGFVWSSHNAAWLEKLNELKIFQEKMGHCNVPSHYAPNVKLSLWVKGQRRQYKQYVNGVDSSLTPERLEALKKLGFVFDVRNRNCSGGAYYQRG